jgi:hypothetical protein
VRELLRGLVAERFAGGGLGRLQQRLARLVARTGNEAADRKLNTAAST